MIYSAWRPHQGGYDHFESSERLGLGDDLPLPQLPAGTVIGVASTDIGRPANGLRRVGSGQFARGSVMPLSRSGLGLGVLGFRVAMPGLLVTTLAFALGWWGRGRRNRGRAG